jgi:hypothetical protein
MSLAVEKDAAASGLISPVSWPISVVLPAPFGPMIACNSPGRHIEMDIVGGDDAAETLGESPRLRAACQLTAPPRQNAVDAAACIKHDQQQQRA